jgi:hypothetical protein
VADENMLEVFRQLHERQNKYTYFLLAAAGAGVAFALDQTRMADLQVSQIPIGVSVLCWGLSFWFGCTNIHYANATLYANHQLLRVRNGQHPRIRAHPEESEAAVEGIESAMESNSENANVNGHRQFRSLVLGAVFYIAWHVWGMYLRGQA